MRGKKEVERELFQADAQIELLKGQLAACEADRAELRAQVTKLQDALIAVRAPEAYRDQQFAREDANKTPLSDDFQERNRINKQVTEEYLRMCEGSLLRSPEDLDDLLAKSLMRTVKQPASLHGNDES